MRMRRRWLCASVEADEAPPASLLESRMIPAHLMTSCTRKDAMGLCLLLARVGGHGVASASARA
jgi:hypothetical protein